MQEGRSRALLQPASTHALFCCNPKKSLPCLAGRHVETGLLLRIGTDTCWRSFWLPAGQVLSRAGVRGGSRKTHNGIKASGCVKLLKAAAAAGQAPAEAALPQRRRPSRRLLQHQQPCRPAVSHAVFWHSPHAESPAVSSDECMEAGLMMSPACMDHPGPLQKGPFVAYHALL